MFLDILKEELLKNSLNYYTDNYDYYTFGEKKPFKKALVNQLKRVFFSRPLLAPVLKNDYLYHNFFLGYLFKYDKYIQPLEFFYNKLESKESKSILTQLVAFRLLGYVKVRLPLSKPEYWQGIKDMEKAKNENDFHRCLVFPMEGVLT